ncbi:amino acid ABC transporter permease [Agromyces aerolatus]|uniref:amino acid ABC transporter permease n=1 Tax=Agromyces sp. LY-1074 TaxID=3074080 RepID=UPI00286E6EE3|nr:amino acid ABC transporter permease [Agromyces sp. LY-1358]
MQGLGLTLLIAAVAIIVPSVLALAVAAARMSTSPVLRVPAQLYIELFRCTPLLVQLLWFFFALPALTGFSLSALASGILALCLNMTAYLAEAYRAGLQAVPKEQIEAARMLGLSRFDILVRIMVPQALRQQVPNILSLDIQLFKDSSLVSVIGVTEMTFQANVLASATYRPLEVFTMLGLMYFAIAFPASLIVSWLERRGLGGPPRAGARRPNRRPDREPGSPTETEHIRVIQEVRS